MAIIFKAFSDFLTMMNQISPQIAKRLKFLTSPHEGHEILSRYLHTHFMEHVDSSPSRRFFTVTEHAIHVKQHSRHFPPLGLPSFWNILLLKLHTGLGRRRPPVAEGHVARGEPSDERKWGWDRRWREDERGGVVALRRWESQCHGCDLEVNWFSVICGGEVLIILGLEGPKYPWSWA